jgi:ABC-2 type transport system permease protein
MRPSKSSRVLNRHVIAVMENEWQQLIRNRVVVYTTTIPSLLLLLLAVSVLVLTSFLREAPVTMEPATGALLQSIPGAENIVFQGPDKIAATLVGPFLVLFQVIPLVVPVTIATYSIIGEKQQRSLEPLLATPIRTWELLLAKALSAAIPGILSTWWCYAAFVLAARFFASPLVYNYLILSPAWILAIVLLAPLFTICAVGLGIIISSRVRDPSSAQQLGSLLILPVIGLLVAQVSGLVQIGLTLILQIAVGICLLDIFLLVIAVRLFRREEILTVWQ